MKLKDGFVLKEIAGECIVVPVDSSLNLDGMITLNATARTIWQALERGADMDEIISTLTSEYDVTPDLARTAADSFISKLKELDFLA